MLKIKNIAFLFAISTTILFSAEGNDNIIHPYSSSTQAGKKDLILRKKFERNLNASDAQKNVHLMDRFMKIKNETLNVSFLQNPVVKIIKPYDTIYVHPHFLTSIILPSNLKILSSDASFNAKQFKRTENHILLQVSRDFISGNIVVESSDQKNRNYIQQIMIKKLEISSREDTGIALDMKYSKYLIKDNYLSTIYRYKFLEKAEPIKVLEDYMTLNAINDRDLRRVFKSDGDYDSIFIKDVIYFIIRDDKFKHFSYNGIGFRVSNKYNVGQKSYATLGAAR